MNYFATPVAQTISLLDLFWQWLLEHGTKILLIILLAFLARFMAGVLINKIFGSVHRSGSKIAKVRDVVTRSKLDDALRQAQLQRREFRMRTLAKVSKNISSAAIFIIAVIMILSELNIDVAPILASVSVAGLAAGIGAQTMIKDILAGMFLLFEDAVAVGDEVDLQYAKGVVENINLRITQVRDTNGVLWTVRNGEVVYLGNYSRNLAQELTDE